MSRLLFFLFLFSTSSLLAQVRVSKLVIKANEKYVLSESDILVADTLIMMDSSTLVLNKLKRDNIVRARIAIFGNYCTIDGRGVNGAAGRDGKQGFTPSGPCLDGTPGKDGTNGLDGTPGINLFLYLEVIKIKGQLIVDLTGGEGGRGGNGGMGGGGSQGTVHCFGGNGSNGGNAAHGGNGGNGGSLTLNSKKTPAANQWIGNKIMVRNSGGAYGSPGKVGYHGSAGLGPSRRNGKDGEPGQESKAGLTGAPGTTKFESN
ncbi:MAG TPA: hypothetical protein PLJ60_12050 [Chryseolinea sp.]|nr:hypothetical protein [Chryseolinea sp.]HPM31057.1 hypothetical protein [Chryseolinea sp.]